jgi:hypothetical protein
MGEQGFGDLGGGRTLIRPSSIVLRSDPSLACAMPVRYNECYWLSELISDKDRDL